MRPTGDDVRRRLGDGVDLSRVWWRGVDDALFELAPSASPVAIEAIGFVRLTEVSV